MLYFYYYCRYHPHVIRFCLSLHAKSPAAYKELRESGVLGTAKGKKTPRDYRNFFKPRASFHPDNIERLKNQTSHYFDTSQSWSLTKHSNELIGFVDLGEEELNVSSGSTDLATHARVFFYTWYC